MDLINPIKCFYVCCRRMFPTIRCSFSGFQDFLYGQKFAIVLDVVACDNKRYRYAYHRSSWLVAGKADPGGYNCEVFLNWLKFILGMAIPRRISFFEESRSRGIAKLHSSGIEEYEINSSGSSGNFRGMSYPKNTENPPKLQKSFEKKFKKNFQT